MPVLLSASKFRVHKGYQKRVLGTRGPVPGTELGCTKPVQIPRPKLIE